MPPQVSTTRPHEREHSPPLAMIAAARAGDERAMEDLIREYQGRVAKFVIAKAARVIMKICARPFLSRWCWACRGSKRRRFSNRGYSKSRANVCMDHHRGRTRWLRIFDPYEPWYDTVAQPDAGVNRERMEAILTPLPNFPGPSAT